MFLKKVKTNKGRVFLQIVEGFRNEKGQISHQVIEKIGFVDDLEGQYPDPIAHFSEVAKQMTKEAKHSRNISFDYRKELIEEQSSLKNVGYLAIKPVLSKLKLDTICTALDSKYRPQVKTYDLLSFLVYSQIINPVSKISSYYKKEQFLENYQFSEDQMYRSLSYLGNSYEAIKDYAYHTTDEAYQLDTEQTYYDGTNFYFEIDREDDFRKKGPSKEERKSPIVSFGLLLDKNHLPIDIKIYPGNESEKTHFTQVIKDLKEKKKIQGKTIFIADKGLNTGQNIFAVLENKDGYIYSKSIKGSDERVKKYIENDVGFEDIYDEYGQLVYRIKGFVNDATITFEHQGKTYKRDIKQQQVVTWSKKYADKSRYEREKLIKKAKSLINSPTTYTKEWLGNAASYLKQVSFDKDGIVVESKSTLLLDIDKIEKEERLDGYYLLVTSELDMPPRDVLKNYRGLSHIEQSFQVNKLFLKLRPVYLQREERIKAHVLISYLSLLILRILEIKILKEQFSMPAIVNSLREYQCALIRPNMYFFFQYDDVIVKLANKGNPKLEIQNLHQIKNLFKNY